jgi:hypothetical protein
MVDVTITGSGRWKYLERTVLSFRKMVTCSQPFRLLVTDDAGYSMSKNDTRTRIIESGWFDKYYFTERQDYSECVEWLFNNIESEFYFHLQDDWEFLSPIDLDPLIALMRKKRTINHIRFSKRVIQPALKKERWNKLGRLKKYNVTIGGIPLVAVPYWGLHPSVNRTAFVQKHKVPRPSQKGRENAWKPSRFELYWLQTLFKGVDRTNLKDFQKKVGTYLFGQIGDAPMILHIGKERAFGHRFR